MLHMPVLPAVAPEPLAVEPEHSRFTTVIVDITHRCNMRCANCYVPNRQVPDLDCDWVLGILARLPQRVQVRLVGGEPTVSKDLPRYIAGIRDLGHEPVLLTNGLALADRNYLKSLKQAGLRMAYLSFNGGFDDEAYLHVDGQACAGKKIEALENLGLERMFTILGMIVVRGVNEHQLAPVVDYAVSHRNIRELHFRSIGAIGRYMSQSSPFSRDELRRLFQRATGCSPVVELHAPDDDCSALHLRHERLRVQLTQWPDMGSRTRGRLTPQGRLAPFFEHVIANEGGY